ncbi:hypothetical protein SAMN05216588_13327 [Pseudomonas flavescens]|uniref:Methyl-accepting chemotaxis protein n=1 Tax=Phytopseudomonas flavescens TaxID=29435 RepID=A0A1G8Q7A0_9GAMM|nr:hypothetical protein SAMN05216588_13327 [Pseudomonas flavescens]
MAAGVDHTSSDTGDSLQRINDMAAQIATTCEQQSSVTEEVGCNIRDVRGYPTRQRIPRNRALQPASGCPRCPVSWPGCWGVSGYSLSSER